jgi:hypothetical protein
MPVLTRSAARRLADDGDATGSTVLALRESVTSKADAVWEHRGGVDIYCGANRTDTDKPQVDHCLEVQLTEMALVRTFSADRRNSTQSMATAQAADLIRKHFNGVRNLNVTSARINQAKRGPFTAALNRIQSDTLRNVTLEQLARQGKARWLVDDGTWTRIERAVVCAYDEAHETLINGDTPALPAAAEIVEGSMEELNSMLDMLGVH